MAHELGSDLQFELTSYLGGLANIVNAPDVVVRREFGCGGARGIDQRRPEFGKLFAAFPKLIEVLREVRIGLPKAGNADRARNDLEAVIGQHALCACQRTTL